MSFVEVDAAVVGVTAAQLLNQAVKVSAAAAAATPFVTGTIPPAMDNVSIRSATMSNAEGATYIAAAQVHVAELLEAAEAVGSSGVAYTIQELANQGVLLV